MNQQEINKLISIASELVGVDISKNFKCRKDEYVLGRQLVMYVIRKHNLLGVVKTGDIFGKDHTTVIHTYNVITNRILTEKTFSRQYSKILDYFNEVRYYSTDEVKDMLSTLTTDSISCMVCVSDINKLMKSL